MRKLLDRIKSWRLRKPFGEWDPRDQQAMLAIVGVETAFKMGHPALWD